MYNRKFDIKNDRDFCHLNKMENKILPMLDEIKDDDKKMVLKDYIRTIFFNQWKS